MLSGGNCSDYPPPNPDTTNQCSSNIGTLYQMPHSCTTPFNTTQKKIWCVKLGSPGEWSGNNNHVGNDCSTDSCAKYRRWKGSCNGCVGIPFESPYNSSLTFNSVTFVCNRTGFNGERLPCCLKDLECNPGPTTFYPNNIYDKYSPSACFADN